MHASALRTSELNMGLYLDSTALEVVYLLTTICTLLYFFSWYRYGYWWRQDVYHLPSTFPFGNFGDFILRRKTLEENFTDIYNKLKGCRYGGGVYFGLTPLLVVRDVELTRSFFSDDDSIANAQCAQQRGLPYSLVTGNCYPQIHHEDKNILVSLESKEAMVLKLVQSAKALVVSIEDSSETTIELNKLVSSYISNVKSSFTNGSHIYYKDENPSEKMLSDMNDSSLTSQFNKIAHSLVFSPQSIKSLSQTEAYNKNVPDGKSHTLILKNEEQCAEEKIEDNEAIEHAVKVFIGSLERFSSTLASTIHEISAHPKIQSRLQEEMDETLGKSGDITYSKIAKLNYVINVISEGFRKYPLYPIVLHRCSNGTKIPGTDVKIGKGTLVCIPVLEYHRDARYYSDPETFEPDRFSYREVRKRTHNAFIPFGDGPESCFGLEFGLTVMKVCILALMSKYNISCSDKPKDGEDITKKKVHLKFSQRT